MGTVSSIRRTSSGQIILLLNYLLLWARNFHLQNRCMRHKIKSFLGVGEGKTHAAAAAKSLQSCPTLCDPTDGSPPGSPVPGILQARTLEWVAIAFSNAWKWKVKGKSLSRVQLFTTPWTAAYQAPLCPWDFPGKSTGVGCHCLLWKHMLCVSKLQE